MTAPSASKFNEPFCIGEIIAEWIFRTSDDLPANRTIVSESLRREIGGAAFNVYWYFNQFGRRSRLVAPIGQSDAKAVQVLLGPSNLGRIDLLETPDESDTLFTIVGQHVHRSVYALANWPSNVPKRILEKCAGANLLILNGGRHHKLRNTFRMLASDSDIPILAFNPSYAIFEYSRDELIAILRRAQITVINAEEFEFLQERVGTLMPDHFDSDSPKVIAVTRGKDGVTVITGDGSFDLPSFASSDAVAIGAGDAFLAGFLDRILEGASVHDSSRYGLALAAIVVESKMVRVTITDEVVRNRMAGQV